MSYTTEVFEQSIYRTKNVVIDKCHTISDSYSTETIKHYYYNCVTKYAFKNLDKLEDAIQLTKLRNELV